MTELWGGMFCGRCCGAEREGGSAIITSLPGRRRHYHFLRHHRWRMGPTWMRHEGMARIQGYFSLRETSNSHVVISKAL